MAFMKPLNPFHLGVYGPPVKNLWFRVNVNLSAYFLSRPLFLKQGFATHCEPWKRLRNTGLDKSPLKFKTQGFMKKGTMLHLKYISMKLAILKKMWFYFWKKCQINLEMWYNISKMLIKLSPIQRLKRPPAFPKNEIVVNCSSRLIRV